MLVDILPFLAAIVFLLGGVQLIGSGAVEVTDRAGSRCSCWFAWLLVLLGAVAISASTLMFIAAFQYQIVPKEPTHVP